MKDRKLIQLLQLVPDEAIPRLSKFLASPYFNTLQKLTDLGAYFVQYHPEFEHEDLSEEIAFKLLFPTKPFNSHEFNRYSSKLYKLVERFIEIEAISEFPYIHGQLRSEFLYKARAEKHFEKSQKDFEKFLKKESSPSSANFFYTYLHEKLAYSYWAQHKPGRTTDAIFQRAFEALDAYYLIELLQAAAILMYKQGKLPNDEYMPLLKPALKSLREGISTRPPLLQAWFLTIELLSNLSSETYYEKLKANILANIDLLPDIDARNIVGIIKKSIQSQISKGGRQKKLEEFFSWHLVEIKEGWIYSNGIIYDNLLNNVITVALALGKIDWAADFLEQSKPYMVPANQHNTYQYNLARISFARNEINESLKYLAQVSFIDEHMALRVKRLELKAFYELEEMEAFESTLNSFRVYSHRLGKKNPVLKELQNQFSTIINHLYRKRVNLKYEETKANLAEMVASNPRLPEYEWLTAKINSLPD